MHSEGRTLFGDTSFFYALLATNDADHTAAIHLARQVEDFALAITTTWEVVVETMTLLRYRHSFNAALIFLDDLLPKIHTVTVGEDERLEALAIFRKWNKDHKISLCDCISYVVITKHLNHAPCLAFDSDFESMGLWVCKNLRSGEWWVHET